MAYCYLCRIPEIDNTYANLLDFDTLTTFRNFISNRTVINLGDYNIKYDGNIPVIDVQRTYDDLLQVDYLYMLKDNIYTCYFIIRKEILATAITRLYLELDVWMTNMFKVEFMTSFVDRCHVHRWTEEGYPAKEIVAEPVALGTEVVEGSAEPMCSTDDGSYIYIASSPLGLVTKDTSSGGDPDEPDKPTGGGCGDLTRGIPSADGFVFIKGYEGLAQYARDIGDGVLTIGYGCTDAYDREHFIQLKALEPVPEQNASEVFAHSLINNYGIPLRDKLEADGILDDITQNMFDALLSFVYNAGYGSLISSDMYASIVAGNYQEAYDYWLTTNILPGTDFEDGLRARRYAEAEMFLNGIYEFRPIPIINAGGVITSYVVTNDGRGYIPDIITNTCTDKELNEFIDGNGNAWYLPLEKGWTSALYGQYPGGGAHYGIDFTHETAGAIRGAIIYAPKEGLEVINVVSGYDGDVSDMSGGFGNYVTLYDSGLNCYIILGHMLEAPSVNIGDITDYNTVLGKVGTSGYSTGYHLHFEIRYGGNSSAYSVNPIADSTLYTWYYRKGSES